MPYFFGLGVSLARTRHLLPLYQKVKEPEEGHCMTFVNTGQQQNHPASLKPVAHPVSWLSLTCPSNVCIVRTSPSPQPEAVCRPVDSWAHRGQLCSSTLPPTWVFFKPNYTRALPCSWLPAGSQQVSTNQEGETVLKQKVFLT